MNATREDVARQAGVSVATVSYVLNKSKPITPETTRRVMDAVCELNYRPNHAARSMTTRSSMHIGVLLENISNPFFGDIVYGFENSAHQQGYFVSVCTNFQHYEEYLDNAISRRLDGMFIAALPITYDDSKLNKLLDHGIRIVISGYSDVDLKKVSSIENDYVSAMRDAVTHLYDRGHRDIAYIAGLSRTMKSDLRAEGYLRMMDELKLPCGDSLIIEGKPPYPTTLEDGYRQAMQLIRRGRPFTAVICINDLMAVGACKAFTESGLRVPEDVALMGFDDIAFSQYCHVPLTSMALNKIAFGKKAFDLLHNNIKLGNTGFYLNKLNLVERQSTAAWR